MQRGLLHKKPKWGDFFHAGFLNKMYLRMNDIVFHGTQLVRDLSLSPHGITLAHLCDSSIGRYHPPRSKQHNGA